MVDLTPGEVAVSLLLNAIRCQTSWIPLKFTYDTIPLLMTSGDGIAVKVPVHQKDERSISGEPLK